MWIEAFSAGKNPAAPEGNEDRFVVLPGRAYAVIDGVTDRSGQTYDGKTSGRLAAEILQAALERLLSAEQQIEPFALLQMLSKEIAKVYQRLELLEGARQNTNLRFGATLALFRHQPDHDEMILVGDSGIRLNGAEIYQVDKALDWITARLRVVAWRELEQRGADAAMLTRLGRQIVFHGALQDPKNLEGLLNAADLQRITADVVSSARARFPGLPAEVILALVEGGIINGQSPHQNSDTSPLGYSCIDGFDIPPRHVTVERRPIGDIKSIELFTDGYFAVPLEFGVAAWEAAADEVERVDPLKINLYPSVKGSFGTVRTDDRTYVGVRT